MRSTAHLSVSVIVACFIDCIFICGVQGFCGKLGSFDYVCRDNGLMFMVSTFPCRSAGRVRLTVLQEKSPNNVIFVDTFKDQDITIKGTDLVVRLQLVNHTDGPHAGNLHTFVKTFTAGNKEKSLKKIFDTYFFLEFATECIKMFDGASHYASPYCKVPKRTGDFSTLCVTNSGVISQTNQSVAIVALNPCAHPFSSSVLLFNPGNSTELLKTYTANKTDVFVPFKDTSGIKLKILYYEEGLQINVVLLFGSTDKNAVELINDNYFPDDSLMCPDSNCIKMSDGMNFCKSKLIVGDNKVKNLTVLVQVNPCGSPEQATISMRLEGHKKVINGTLGLEDLSETQIGPVLDFSGKGAGNLGTTSGFVPEEGGEISLAIVHSYSIEEYVHKEPPNAVMIILNRHYPTAHYAFPLVRTEFLLNGRGCPGFHKGKKEKRTVAKALIGVSVFLVIVIVVCLALVWWRRKQKVAKEGLPYHIELDVDDPDDMKL